MIVLPGKLHLKTVFVLLLLALLACACADMDAAPTADSEEDGSIRGRVAEAAAYWEGSSLLIFAAPFYGNSGQEGFYVLEPDLHPHAALAEDGSFSLQNVPPGEYVLVVGPSAEEGLLLVDAQGEVVIASVQAGTVLELGRLELKK